MSKPFLEPLVLYQKPRLAVQLTASLLLLLVVAGAVLNFPKVVANVEPSVGSLGDMPVWVPIVMCVLALIPAAYTFLCLKKRLNIDFEPLKN